MLRAPVGMWCALVLFAVAPGCSGRRESAGTSNDALSTWLPISAPPAWATADNFMGSPSNTDVVSFQVHLALKDQAAADAELAAIGDPDSPTFGQFLTEDQFVAKYAPSDDDVAAVRAHLEGHGMTIGEVPSNRLYVAAQGTVAQVQDAFGTTLGQYQVGGQIRRAPSSSPRLPPQFAKSVAGTLGLTQSPNYLPHNVSVGGIPQAAAGPKGAVAPNTCSEYWGAQLDTTDPPLGGGFPANPPYSNCGYSPPQLRRAYGMSDAVLGGNDGTGVSIAIVDAFHSPTLLADAQTYAAQHNDDYPLQASQFTAYDAPGTTPPPPPDTGWYGEQSLDVEAVHTIAPGANIVFVGAASASDADLVSAINYILTNNLATIVSNSYGSAEGQANDFVVWEAVATHAGLKGVGLYFSAGDSGDENANLGFPSPDFPASLPTVTSVGGTSLALDQFDKRVFEVGWETGVTFLPQMAPGMTTTMMAASDAGATEDASVDGGVEDAAADSAPPAPTPGDGGIATSPWAPAVPGQFVFGGGGGTSMVFPQPDYQVGAVPAALANIPGAPARVVPDVSMLGDPMTGFLIGMTQNGTYGESAIGGTSLACPLFAASMALVEQRLGHPIGFANKRLYKNRAKIFVDVAPLASPQAAAVPGGVMTTFAFPNLAINTAVGYDNVTGLGTPNGEAFLSGLQ